MADPLHVELVSADREVWSGEATMVVARTTEGDVGVLPSHSPLLGLLIDGVVEIRTTSDDSVLAAVSSGFLSIADNRVSVLAEFAQLAEEIDLTKARHDLERAQAAGEDDTEAREMLERARVQIRAAEKAA